MDLKGDSALKSLEGESTSCPRDEKCIAEDNNNIIIRFNEKFAPKFQTMKTNKLSKTFSNNEKLYEGTSLWGRLKCGGD